MQHPRPIIDACVHHQWADQSAVMEYMSSGWREYLNQSVKVPGGTGLPLPVLPLYPYFRPGGDALEGSTPENGVPGSSLAMLQDQLLDRHGIERAVLNHGLSMFASVNPNPHLAREVVSAINRWTAEQWTSRDRRLSALALVPTQLPEDAAAEIARVADDPSIVGVLIAGNGLSKTFGHPIYHPIYRAAAEYDLPIVIHTGGEAPSEVMAHTAAGGVPGTYAEFSIFRPQPLMTHMVSMIGQGVFLKYPDLRLLLTGGGVAWLPSILWRFDTEYRAYRREAPWIKENPSEIFRNHVRVSTFPLDVAPDPSQLTRAISTIEAVEDLLVYASGYPDWDADMPDTIVDRIPDPWQSKVYYENALDFFRWDGGGARTPPAETDGSAVGVME